VAKKRWSDLSSVEQRAIIAGGVAEAVMTSYALVDLARRPKRRVRGPKLLWVLGLVVQPFGPLAYLRWGRRR
jgi:Phospholipase_D-nuclease N-terminal